MNADLDELDRLLREATAGPWFVYVHTGDGTTIEPGDDWTVYGKHREPVVHEGGFTVHAAANAALIAALRNHAEELIRDARRMQWAEDNVTTVDAIGDPDNFVRIWYTPEWRQASGPTIREAIDAAIAQEQK